MAVSRNENYNYLYNGGKVTGTVDASEGTISGLFDGAEADAEVSIVDNGTGDFTISVTNFRGRQAVAKGFATPIEADVVVSAREGTYSGDTASVQFLVRTVAGSPAASDADFNFTIEAY